MDTHNTLFVTLFLIAIGIVLNEISDTLKPHEFSKWRRKTFHYKHERYLQQAQQLANIGPFATKYAAMGKKRLLALDHLRKTKRADDCKELLKEHPLPKLVEETFADSVRGRVHIYSTAYQCSCGRGWFTCDGKELVGNPTSFRTACSLQYSLPIS